LTAGNRTERFLFELRWPLVIQILILVFVLASLPDRTRLLPHWFSYLVAAMLVLSMFTTRVSGGHPRWVRIESTITMICCAWAELVNLVTLGYVVRELLSRPAQFSGRHLLTSSVASWITNVIAFSIIYWSIDRGGPEARINRLERRADWLFAHESAPPKDVAPDWRPMPVDYLFLSFCTATAFSPTDVLPLTGRAKMLMMVESSVSLVTLVIVAARAINILV
jgi:hypothetical protein